jgi:GntR family transcriptional regulator
MNIIISGASDKPIYQQIFEQLSAQIIRGDLAPGTALPPIRTVAKELRISVITVKKAWEELDRLGYIYSMVGRGTFVADLSTGELDSTRLELLDEKMKRDIAYYKELGLSEKEIIQSVKKHYHSMGQED